MNAMDKILLSEDASVPSLREGENVMPPASLQGQTLGRYRVLEPLGRGGMARVYRAYHPQLDRYVAIKVLRSDLVEEEEGGAASWRVRFRREAQAVAALRHPNIVQVFDFDMQDDVYYMVMELLEGDSLKTRLIDYRVRGERMAYGEIVRVLLDVLDGLAYAHSEGMVHRDVKPANILLNKRGQAVIGDFGIAQIVGSTRHTLSGALLGTLSYMAPEQGMEGQSDARSDIYSLGIVLYEMMTQRTPFEADTPLAVLMKHVNDPLPLPRLIAPDIPEPFERVVLKALAKRPEDRYQSAEEMALALRGAAEEAGVELPARISLPLSFRTAEAPSESVVIFSGTARERITDAHFAQDDTDATLGDRLAAEGADVGQALRGAGRDLLDAMGAMAHVGISKMATALQDAAESVRGGAQEKEEAGKQAVGARFPRPNQEARGQEAEREEARKREAGAQPVDEGIGEMPGAGLAVQRPARGKAARRKVKGRRIEAAGAPRGRGRVGVAILGALGLLAISNLCMLTMAAPTGLWDIYERGWTIEIFLVAWGLCIIMYVASSIWMLLPVGVILGTGALLAYSSLTGNWGHWSFLWLFETWIIAGSIVLSIALARGKNNARGLSRALALFLSLVSIAWIIVVGVIVGVGSLISSLISLILP
jgi:tRNA A-37 threonylcarbamoyl transferase component Bud32